MDKINRTFRVLKEKGTFSTRTLRVALLGIMIIALFSIVWKVGSGAVTFGDFEFDDTTGTITKYGGDDSNVEIPSEIGGVSVTTIGGYAFSGCSLTSITIPDSVTTIGIGAFCGCSGLTSITLSDSLTSIGNGAFAECTSLTSITIPDSVTTIGEGAFSGCSGLTSIALSDSLTSIGNGAFLCCDSLTSITLSDSLTTIGKSAFSGCSGLTSITLSDSLTSIGDFAFADCTNLTSITIPDSVTTIGKRAFNYCTSLTSITIPDSVTSLGGWAVQGCSSLTSITLPDSVTTIDEHAFEGCTSLTSITLPDSVTTIGKFAFVDCWSLTSITLPDSLTTIGEYAFDDCTGLTSIKIPDSVTSIGVYAFSGCTSLTSVTLPDSLTTIDRFVFYGCTNLETIINFSVSTQTIDPFSFANTYGDGGIAYAYPSNTEFIDRITEAGYTVKYISAETLEILGDIKATIISITVPTSIEFVANQEDGSIIASNFEIINNTNVDLVVSLCDFKLSENSSHTFTDVLPNEKDWLKLGVSDSKTYISLGLKPLKTDDDGWVVCLENQPIYAKAVKEIDDMRELGTIRKKSEVSFEVVGNTGRAFLETVRVIYDLVFMFELR